MSEKVIIYAEGFCYLSVCAEKHLTADEVARLVEPMSPSGLEHGWFIADEPFKGGEPNPCECSDNPERRHWLLAC